MLKSTSSVFEELRSETTEEDDANGTETEMEGGGQAGAATEADRMRNANQTSNEEAEEEQDHVLIDLDAAHRETLALQCQSQDTSGGVTVKGQAEAEEEQPGPSHSQHSFSVKPHHKMTSAELQQHQLMQQSYIKQEVYEIDKTIREFWPAKKRRFNESTDTDMREVGRKMELPMARVKKIMRIDDEMKNMMIASDAPLFLAMACELFVEELTLLSWQVVEDGRRKTMQKSDVATAVALHDHLDFLVDIVPREEKKYLPTFAQNRQQQQQSQSSHSHSQQPECSTSSSSHSSHQQPQQSQSMQQVTQQVAQLQPGQAVVLTALPAENGFIVPVSANSQGTQIIQLGTLSQAPEQLQYVFADVATVNGEEWQLENGITVHATPIGQPFPIDQSDPNATIHMLPSGVQIIQMPSQNIELNGQHLQMQQVQQVVQQSSDSGN